MNRFLAYIFGQRSVNALADYERTQRLKAEAKLEQTRAALRDARDENLAFAHDIDERDAQINLLNIELRGAHIELDNATRHLRVMTTSRDALAEQNVELRKQYATRDEFDHAFSEAERGQHLAVEEGGSFRFRTKPSSMSVYQQQAEAREAS